MNFNYSYRAFLLSCLLVGNLVLLLVSVKLSGEKPPEESFAPLEYLDEFPEEETVIDISEKIKIETNTAYNEAEKFISEIEDSRNETLENTEEDIDTDGASNEDGIDNDMALNDAQDKLDAIKEKLNNNSRKRAVKKEPSANRKTTISYRLEGRSALRLRNPVYTCEASGKIVIGIEVNDMGKVVKAAYNKAASTTTNGCLIDSAMEYANRARFTTSAGKSKQLGTITYVFPGQY